MVIQYYYPHLEISGDPYNLIGSQQCDLFTNSTTCNFCCKSHLLPSQWERNTKTANQISMLVLKTNQIAGKWKTKKPNYVVSFATFPPPPPKKKMDEFNYYHFFKQLFWIDYKITKQKRKKEIQTKRKVRTGHEHPGEAPSTKN